MDPEEAVVIGSAIQAALIVEDQQELSEDMIPLSIGIESAKGIFTRVIPRHTTVPMKRTIKIPSWCAYGECLRVRIFLGEHVMVHHNLFLGEIELINNRSSYQGSVDFELTFEVDKDCMVKVSARNADDQLEAAADVRKAFKPFSIRKKVMCKHNVDKAVKISLLDWDMYVTEIHARLRNLARYTMNTLGDVLSARKDELPKDLCEDAVKALADLRMALGGDVLVLKDKMLCARSVESMMLNWRPPSESRRLDGPDYSDYEN